MKKIAYFAVVLSITLCSVFSTVAQNENTTNNELKKNSQFSESIVEKVTIFETSKKKSKKNKKKLDELVILQIEKRIIPAVIYNSEGKIVKELKQTDFTVFENGVEQEITYFKPAEEGITVVLMIDVSNSASVKFELVKSSFIDFINRIRTKDKMVLVSYDEKTKLIADTRMQREETKEKITKIKTGGGTSLYDSIDVSLSEFIKDVQEPTAFVLLTDGVDTTSKKNSFVEILKKVNDSNAVFTVIYNNTFEDFAKNGVKIINGGNLEAVLEQLLRSGAVIGNRRNSGLGMSKEEYEVGVKFLNSLVLLSGGRAVKTDSTAEGFKNAFEQIYFELTNQYFIGYKPKNNSTAPQPREIKVRVNRPDLYVRTRGSLLLERKDK